MRYRSAVLNLCTMSVDRQCVHVNRLSVQMRNCVNGILNTHFAFRFTCPAAHRRPLALPSDGACTNHLPACAFTCAYTVPWSGKYDVSVSIVQCGQVYANRNYFVQNAFLHPTYGHTGEGDEL